jgi:hypothetical protein
MEKPGKKATGPTSIFKGKGKILIAVDYSGSTGGSGKYWNAVADVIGTLPREKLSFLLWDDGIYPCDYATMMDFCFRKRGMGGTDPSVAASYIAKQFAGEPLTLYLFTDGQVSASSVEKCDVIFKNSPVRFDKVYVHIWNTGGQINLSVSAPFTRFCEYEIYCDGKNLAGGDSSMKIDLKDWENVDHFLENHDKLRSAITMQNLGKMNNDLRNSLLELKKKLIANYMKKSNINSADNPLIQALDKKDYSKALREVNSLVTSYQKQMDGPKMIEKAIQDMITACTSPGNFSFDLIQSARAQRADAAVNVQPDQVEEVLADEKTFECPINYDNDVPAILIVQPERPILANVDANIVDDIINCPLNLWKYDDLVAKVASHIDHPVGCQSMKGGLFRVSPMTRRPLIGAITLGAAEDHCKATNWTLAQLFSGGKLLGNPDLWTLLLYYITRNRVGFLKEQDDLMSSFCHHLKFRLRNHNTNLGLSGLPDYPLVKVPVGVALWYCVVSADLYAEKNVAQDRLRAFGQIGEIFVHILDVLDMPYNKDYTRERVTVLRVFYWMMSMKLNKQKLLDLLRSYYQNYLYLPSKDRFVFLDGPAPEVRKEGNACLPEFAKEIPLEVLITIANLVDPSKKNADIIIEKRVAPTRVHFKRNYGYPAGLPKEDVAKKLDQVKICPATMRPYYIDPVKKKEWNLCLKEVWNVPPSKMLSLRNYANKYVVEIKKFPHKKDDFYAYLYDKQCKREGLQAKDTLPEYIEQFVSNLFVVMNEAIKAYEAKHNVKMTPKLYKQLVEASRKTEDRKRLEREWNSS